MLNQWVSDAGDETESQNERRFDEIKCVNEDVNRYSMRLQSGLREVRSQVFPLQPLWFRVEYSRFRVVCSFVRLMESLMTDEVVRVSDCGTSTIRFFFWCDSEIAMRCS